MSNERSLSSLSSHGFHHSQSTRYPLFSARYSIELCYSLRFSSEEEILVSVSYETIILKFDNLLLNVLQPCNLKPIHSNMHNNVWRKPKATSNFLFSFFGPINDC